MTTPLLIESAVTYKLLELQILIIRMAMFRGGRENFCVLGDRTYSLLRFFTHIPNSFLGSTYVRVFYFNMVASSPVARLAAMHLISSCTLVSSLELKRYVLFQLSAMDFSLLLIAKKGGMDAFMLLDNQGLDTQGSTVYIVKIVLTGPTHAWLLGN